MNLGEPSPHPDPLPSHQNGSGEGTGRGHQLLFNAKSMRQVHGRNAGEKIERRLSMNLGEPSPHPDPLPSHQNGSGEGTGRGHQLLFNAKHDAAGLREKSHEPG